jgi:hypothetical protein
MKISAYLSLLAALARPSANPLVNPLDHSLANPLSNPLSNACFSHAGRVQPFAKCATSDHSVHHTFRRVGKHNGRAKGNPVNPKKQIKVLKPTA